MEGTQLVAQFLAALLTGGGTYKAADWLFNQLAISGVRLSARQKRIYVLPICAAIALLALCAEVMLRIVPYTPDALFVALFAGFTASQMFHTQDLAS